MREDGQRTGFILGSVAQTGSLLLFDDLEGLWKWKTVDGWRTGRAGRSGLAAYGGNYGGYLIARVVLPNGPGRCFLGRSFGCRSLRTWAVEVVIGGRLGREPELVYVTLELVRNGRMYSAGVLYDAPHDIWAYEDGQDSWAWLAGVSRKLDLESWHRIRFDVDFNRGEYVALDADGEVFDLRGISFGDEAEAGGDRSTMIIGVGRYSVGTSEGWFDDVLVREI